MNSNPLGRFLWASGLTVLQCFIFGRLPLGTFVFPCIYILFILFLPFGYSRIRTMLWAFGMGLSVDLLSTDLVGIHAAGAVTLAFARFYLLKLFSTKADVDAYAVPSSGTQGWRACTGYVLLSTVLYLSVYFLLDDFGAYDLADTFLRILLSALCSTLLILLLQAMLSNHRKQAL
jgi:rod shape-determining protein MreD